MPRLYVKDPLKIGTFLTLTPPQSHYVKNVMRLEEGSPIRIFNGQEGEFMATLQYAKKSCTLTVQELIRPQIQHEGATLFFTPLKKNRMDFLIEKSVELGVSRLQPILTQRTIVRNMNMSKTEAHIIEATEQCERLAPPTLSPLISLKEVAEMLKQDQTLYLCQERAPHTPHLSTVNPKKTDAILVGPEGGFSPEEIAHLTTHPHISPVSLGDTILRAETAALCALSHLNIPPS